MFTENIYLCTAKNKKMSGSTSRSGNDTLTVETGVRIPYPILQKKTALKFKAVFFSFIIPVSYKTIPWRFSSPIVVSGPCPQ